MSLLQPSDLEVIQDALGICGCGNPEGALQLVRDVLARCKPDGWDSLDALLDARKDLRGVFVLYALDRAGYIEHGTTLYCSWLTDLGEAAQATLNAAFPALQ